MKTFFLVAGLRFQAEEGDTGGEGIGRMGFDFDASGSRVGRGLDVFLVRYAGVSGSGMALQGKRYVSFTD